MTITRKLIEVALQLKDMNLAAARGKSIHHGGVSTLDQNGVLKTCMTSSGRVIRFKDGGAPDWGRQAAAQFFRVRLWDWDDLPENLFKTYHKLPESLRAELPLKRTWVIVQED